MVRPEETPVEAAVRITNVETGLHYCYYDVVEPGHKCDYDFIESSEDCVVYQKAQLGYKKVTYWIAVLTDPNAEIYLSPKYIQYGWFDVERACKFAMYQNCPSAFLKADYHLRKVLPTE